MRLRALALVLLIGSTCAICVSSAVSAAPRQPASVHQHDAQAGSLAHGTQLPDQSAPSPSPVLSAPASATRSAAQDPAAQPAQPRPSGAIGTAEATTAHPPAIPDWLIEVNRYRAGAGLGPVTDQPAWDAGIRNHLIYATKTDQSDISGTYASLHTENPQSAYYTPTGALEASRSDLFFGAPGSTAVDFIDGWLSAPFHAIGILRPRLTQVAFAMRSGAAGLDVIGGLASDGATPDGPVLFPGDGMTTKLNSYTGSESPNPIESCGWNDGDQQYGLPLIALLPKGPSANLAAQVSGPGGVVSTTNGQLCVVDEHTYRSTDPVYGRVGKQIIEDDQAVLLIAKTPYRPGKYTATIRQPGQRKIAWSFTVSR